MCLEEIGHCAQRYANHARFSGQHDWGDLYGHLMSTRIFTLIMNKKIVGAPNIMRQMVSGTMWISNHLALIVYFISYTEVGAQRK